MNLTKKQQAKKKKKVCLSKDSINVDSGMECDSFLDVIAKLTPSFHVIYC